jgi:hypothetical protein
VQLLWPRNIIRPGPFRQFTDLLQGQLRNCPGFSHQPVAATLIDFSRLRGSSPGR